jgi:uncharacterized protein YqgV (UPF0045/DUF77 family)
MRIYRKVYRKTLLALLGITKLVSSTETTIPGKWHNLFDSVKVSSQAVHAQLSILDEEVTEEYQELEQGISRKIGRGKLYTEKDLYNAQKRIENVNFESRYRGNFR